MLTEGPTESAGGPRRNDKETLAREYARRDDAYWGIEFDEIHGYSHFRSNGYGGTQCTGFACAILERLPNRTRVYGFLSEENPTSAIAQAAGGHDFAVIDDRFIVDPWLGEFSCPLAELEDCDQQVFDLHCAQDALQVQRLYGLRAHWKEITAQLCKGSAN